MSDRAAFDPTDPFDAMAEAIRNDVCEVAMSLDSRPGWRNLPEDQRIACLMAGLMTGTVGVLICFIKPENRDEFAKVLADYVPDAYALACSILENGEGIDVRH